jgi:ferredoxin
MVRVEFGASPFGPATAAEAAPGERLMDVCDEAAAPVPFSCRNATCGTCLVRISHGIERLDPVGSDERSVLDALDAHADARLACRARVVASDGTIAVSLDLSRGF